MLGLAVIFTVAIWAAHLTASCCHEMFLTASQHSAPVGPGTHLDPLAQLGPGPVGPIGPVEPYAGPMGAHWPILQVYKHPTGLQTSSASIQASSTATQTSYRYVDMLHVSRHPAGMKTSRRYTGILKVYRRPAGIQKVFVTANR